MIDFKDLIKAGVHFGHQKARWCPKMEPYIWGFRRGTHLIDVSKTAHQLEKAAQFLQEVASQVKQIFFVGTKKAAQKSVQDVALRLNMPYATHRWIGGSMTNYAQVKKAVTKLLYFEDILAKSSEHHYTKKELNTYQKMVDRLRKNVGGIVKLAWPIGAVVIFDINKEKTAFKEAKVSGIPVVALIDTNSDPSGVDYVIPGNDDSPKSIDLIACYLADAVEKGKKIAAQNKKKNIEQQEVAKETVAVDLAAFDVEDDTDEEEVEEGHKPVKKAVKKDSSEDDVAEKARGKKPITAKQEAGAAKAKTKVVLGE